MLRTTLTDTMHKRFVSPVWLQSKRRKNLDPVGVTSVETQSEFAQAYLAPKDGDPTHTSLSRVPKRGK